MREIKFRAWNKESKQYVPAMTIQEMIYSTKNEFSLEQLYEWFIFEQCTGIKDKNGKEIYEGDIIEYKTVYEWDKKLIKRAEVVFENGMFSPAGVIMDLSRSKIIGNIYENPELLEVN